MKCIIFGAGDIGRRLCGEIKNIGNDEVLCFVDNNRHKQDTVIDGVRVLSPDKIFDFDYDKIIIATSYTDSMLAQLLDMGIERNKIEIKGDPRISVRIQWLRDFSSLYYARAQERERERERA
jgi:FlaA1/EpsC-like NDP-sugar epimerase